MLSDKYFVTPRIYTSAALETASLVTGAVAVSGGAKLLGLLAENTDSVNNWVQIFDGYAQPSNGAVPMVSLKVASGQQISLDASVFHCVPVTKGIVVVLSSTGPTLTAVATKMFVTCFWI